MNFTWSHGRQLENITFKDDTKATYKYNESGLRIYKDTETATTTYEWDDTKLIRETVTYKTTGKKYDIWYLYDTTGDMIGFEYGQLNDINNNLQKTRVYYEKNLQGDVIGLLDSRGAEIITYAYDAWGNVLKALCYEGNEIAYELNHIKYRSYYQDDETEFYYLQSRYYNPGNGRFVNADEIKNLMMADSILGYNLYVYCLGNPVNNIDPDGRFALIITLISYTALAKLVIAGIAIVAVAAILTDPYVKRSLNDAITALGASAKNFCKSVATCVDDALTKARKKSRNNKYEVHHIVAQAATKASATRLLLKKVNISVQSSLNKVSIKYNLHRHLHADAYYIAVHTLLKKAEGSYAKTTKTLTFIKALLLAASSKTP